MKKKFFLRNLSLFLLPLIIPILLLGIFSILISQHFIRENVEKNNMNMLQQSKESIEMMLKDLDSLSLSFGSDPVITKRLKEILASEDYSLDKLDSLYYIKNYIDVPVNSKLYIHSIYVYFKNTRDKFISSTNTLSNLNNFIDTDWYESYMQNHETLDTWSEPRMIRFYYFDKSASPVVTFYKNLYSTGTFKSTGVVVLNVYTSYIENMLTSLSTEDQQSIIVVNEQNQILFQNSRFPYMESLNMSDLKKNPGEMFTLEAGNQRFIVLNLPSERYNWNYISVVPHRTLYKLPRTLSFMTIGLLVLSSVLGLFLAFYVTRKNYNQINRIISILESAENEQALPEMPKKIDDEYGYIIQNIIKTFIEQSYLKIQLSERKYKMQALEFVALQSQINPHFLYNTLHTIYWQVLKLSGEPNLANQMISNLTNILEYSLSNPNTAVTLEEEIRNTRSYIEIQKVRYSDRFEFIWEYDADILHCMVIRLMLQPLIENSIYHGIKPKQGSGGIKVRIQHRNSFLHISIIDSGVGISRNELETLRERLKEENDSSEHIGLFNTNKRLMLRYGSQYQIRVLSKSGLGTAIQISIPACMG